MSTPKASPRGYWTGPIIVIICAVLGLFAFVGLAYIRIVNGWSSEVAEIDRDVIVTVKDVEPMFDQLPVRLDAEEWSKVWRPGERCSISYAYDHPDLNRPLSLRSYAFRFATRREAYEKFQELTKEKLQEFGALAPQAEYVVRDKELPMDDESRFGSFNVDKRPIAYFFARRRGLNLYLGFIRTDELDDASLGEVFAPPIDHLEEWSPSQ